MREYTQGSVSKRGRKDRLVWRGNLRFREGAGEPWRQLNKVLETEDGEPIRAYPDKPDGTPDNRGRATAEAALRRWRAALVDQDALEAMEAERERLEALERARRVSVADYVDRYIDSREAMASLEASTVKDYRNSAKLIRAEFAGTAIQELTRAEVEAFEVKLLRGERLAGDRDGGTRGPLSAATVGKVHRLLKMVCGHAKDIGGTIARNPVEGVKPPQRKKADKNALDAESRARLVEYIRDHEPTPRVAGAALALYAGLGPGEACGLRWRNVDLDRREIRIDEAIGTGKGGAYAKTPKVESRRRTIPIPSRLVEVLERRRAAYVADCTRAGVPLAGSMYVLGDPTGRHYSPTLLSKGWSALASDEGYHGTKGPRVAFYDLRHTYATVLIASKADVGATAALMGHSSPFMTLDVYASADPEAMRSAADTMDAAYGKVRPIRRATGTDGGANG